MPQIYLFRKHFVNYNFEKVYVGHFEERGVSNFK